MNKITVTVGMLVQQAYILMAAFLKMDGTKGEQRGCWHTWVYSAT